ncbi:ERF family protein [Acinetobacter seifertii]|uniref:ERF family protein n=1 Tax=Acinetobacter seifertii TaxID=1530123 RepID=UPI0019060A41|nr:ERF family protein [Acinetobacter seifertii]MBJ9425168.1 ERF family protein [Acinetobacter seifertii]
MQTGFNLNNNQASDLRGVHVVHAIAAVHKTLAKMGIAKSRRTNSTNMKFTNYNFRGIEDMYNLISPLMAENGLLCIPTVKDTKLSEIRNQNGGITRHALVTVTYNFISVEDASIITAEMVGEAIDTADKAVSKALSMAHKGLYEQAFSIPTRPFLNDESQPSNQEIQSQIPNSQPNPIRNVNAPDSHELDAFIALLRSIGCSFERFLNKRRITENQLTREVLRQETINIEKYLNQQGAPANQY